MPEVPGPAFYDQDYFEARSRQSLPHVREVVYPLAERTARFLVRRLQPRRVLDLGCAKGFLVEAFRAQGVPAAFGADLSGYAVAAGSEAVRGRLLVADVQAGLPFRARCVDLVTAVDLFEHLADPAPVLGEIGRVLWPGGAAYLKICHPRHPNARRDPSHIGVRPLAEWRRLFRRAGLASQRLYEAEFTPLGGLPGRLRSALRRAREWAGIGTPADYKFLLRNRPDG